MVFHLKPAFGPQVLRSITRDQMRTFLDKEPKHSRAVLWTISGGTSFQNENGVNAISEGNGLNGVTLDSQAIEKMERETGIEPATSSLGRRL